MQHNMETSMNPIDNDNVSVRSINVLASKAK